MTDVASAADQELTIGPMSEFTYDTYEEFLETFLARGYEFRQFDETPTGKSVYLRHDVDWSPERARTMARIEAERDVTSTYFVLVNSPIYNVRDEQARDALAEIESLGHRVGVHFSTHQYWTADPGDDAIVDRVREEQTILGTVVNDVADAVSFHIPPDWVLGVDYEGFTNTYAPAYLEEMAYAADSNQRWRDEPPFDGPLPRQAQILVHPGVWADDDQEFLERLADERDARFDSMRSHLEEQYVSAVE